MMLEDVPADEMRARGERDERRGGQGGDEGGLVRAVGREEEEGDGDASEEEEGDDASPAAA